MYFLLLWKGSGSTALIMNQAMPYTLGGYCWILVYFLYQALEHSRQFQLTPEILLQYKWARSKTIYKQLTMKNNAKNISDLKPSVIGVDLGSYFTKIAAVDRGVVDVITNQANLRQTPSVVGYGHKERMIGETGHTKMKSNLSNTVVAPQRYLGFSQSAYIKQEGEYAACPPKYEGQNLSFKVESQGKEERLNAEQVTASLLTKIDSTVKLNKLNNKYSVIAVPDYLTHNERKALLDSVNIARESQQESYGYSLVNESTAVGIDYGFYKMNQFPEKEEEAQVVLFIDFGHSKLSLYAMKFTKKYQKVLFQKHMRQLGCKNMDQLMFQFYSNLFEAANPNLEIRVKESRKAVLKLFQNIEKQRKVFTGISEYDFGIDCLLEDNDLSYSMTREQFQTISKPVLQQIQRFFQEAKEKMTQFGIQIGHIELIGGGSRIPSFIRTVSDVFGVEPSRTLNSSQCIARGAALSAAIQSSLFRVKEYLSFDACVSGLICSWKGEGEDIQNEASQVFLMEDNEMMLGQKTVEFTIKPTKQKMQFSIKAADIVAGVNPQILSFSLLFPELKQEREFKLKLVTEFDKNEMISKVSAFKVGEKEEPLELSDIYFNEKFSKEQMKEMVAKERSFLINDQKIVHSYQLRNHFESKIYALKDQLDSASRDPKTKDFVNPTTLNQYFCFFSEIESRLDEIEDFNQELGQIQEKMKQFFCGVESLKAEYQKIEEELSKLQHFIQSMIAGKIKSIRFYPGEEVQKVSNWIKSTKEDLMKRPKYTELPTNVKEIIDISNSLKQKIEQCQTEEIRKEREAQRQYYQPEPHRYGTRNNHNNSFDFNPYATNYRGYDKPIYEKPRGRGRSSYNPYGNGFFPGFSGFF